MKTYESPIIEIIEVLVDKGFANSYPQGGEIEGGLGGSEGMSGGGGINVGW